MNLKYQMCELKSQNRNWYLTAHTAQYETDDHCLGWQFWLAVLIAINVHCALHRGVNRFLKLGGQVVMRSAATPSIQRSYQRWLDKRIYKMEMKFWAVLGNQG